MHRIALSFRPIDVLLAIASNHTNQLGSIQTSKPVDHSLSISMLLQKVIKNLYPVPPATLVNWICHPIPSKKNLFGLPISKAKLPVIFVLPRLESFRR